MKKVLTIVLPLIFVSVLAVILFFYVTKQKPDVPSDPAQATLADGFTFFPNGESQSINRYSHEGTLLEEIPLPSAPLTAKMAPNGKIIYYTLAQEENSENPDDFSLMALDLSQKPYVHTLIIADVGADFAVNEQYLFVKKKDGIYSHSILNGKTEKLADAPIATIYDMACNQNTIYYSISQGDGDGGLYGKNLSTAALSTLHEGSLIGITAVSQNGLVYCQNTAEQTHFYALWQGNPVDLKGSSPLYALSDKALYYAEGAKVYAYDGAEWMLLWQDSPAAGLSYYQNNLYMSEHSGYEAYVRLDLATHTSSPMPETFQGKIIS